MSDPAALPIAIIACNVFQGFLEHYLPDDLAKEITFLDYGLHTVPRNLKNTIQEKIDCILAPSLVVLGYGLCGNGLHNIKAGKHTLLIPRTDDCIALLLGSYAAYRRQFDETPGTYYLSKGWLESGSNPLQEYHSLEQKYGEQQAKWLMDTQYRNYKRLALVAHQPEDLEKYRSRALEVAEYCAQWGMRYEEILGSDAYVKQLAAVMVDLALSGQDFIIVPPGGELKQNMFIRL
jgi:hypothetical protein